MFNIVSNSPINSALSDCHKRIQQELPPVLAEIVIRHFPTNSNITVSHCQSSFDNYRCEGVNFVQDNYNTYLKFFSVNFGICCGAQLLTSFINTAIKKEEFIREYFKTWVSLTNIPHFGILVKKIKNGMWEWHGSDIYPFIAEQGILIREWRNPMYTDHLLCLYQFCNMNKYGSFLDDTAPSPQCFIK